MIQKKREYIILRNQEPYKNMALPQGKGKAFCQKLAHRFPQIDWSIRWRFYPLATD